MQYRVSIKEYSKNGKRYIKFNDSVYEIDDRYDTGYVLYLLFSWQHRSEQARIDQLIELEERYKNAEQESCRYEDADYVLEQFFRFLDGESSDFEIKER